MRTIKNRNENGRPKLATTDIRKYRIEVRFATAEYYALKAKAKAAGATISEFIRTALQNCTVKERLRPQHLKHILQLTGMANNLNQIAKRANAAGYTSASTDSERLAKEIDNVIKSIENDG
ncbi:MAG: plasmid mobilization relaxosome protein MobC [Bacteroides sp.]